MSDLIKSAGFSKRKREERNAGQRNIKKLRTQILEEDFTAIMQGLHDARCCRPSIEDVSKVLRQLKLQNYYGKEEAILCMLTSTGNKLETKIAHVAREEIIVRNNASEVVFCAQVPTSPITITHRKQLMDGRHRDTVCYETRLASKELTEKYYTLPTKSQVEHWRDARCSQKQKVAMEHIDPEDKASSPETTTPIHEAIAADEKTPPRVAHTFWAARKSTLSPRLPNYAMEGLRTAIVHFDKVVLWQYEDVPDAPEGVEKRDAATLLPTVVKDELMVKNVTVAHIADVVRFRAAARYGGWVVDADTLWLRAPPSSIIFATLWSKRKGLHAKRSQEWKALKNAFAKEDWDGGDTDMATPFSVSPTSAFAKDLLETVESVVTKCLKGPVWSDPPTKCQWMILMKVLAPLVVKHNLGDCVRPPIEYGVSPYWKSHVEKILEPGFFDAQSNCREIYGVTFPSTDEILRRAYCVPTSFALAERRNKHLGAELSTLCEEFPGCLLDRVYEKASFYELGI